MFLVARFVGTLRKLNVSNAKRYTIVLLHNIRTGMSEEPQCCHSAQTRTPFVTAWNLAGSTAQSLTETTAKKRPHKDLWHFFVKHSGYPSGCSITIQCPVDMVQSQEIICSFHLVSFLRPLSRGRTSHFGSRRLW